MASGLFTLKQQVQALRQGAWSGQKPKAVDYLVVAGGGGGGRGGAGGGGAGGLLQGIAPVSTGQTLVVTVGTGGASATSYGEAGANGTNSVFGSLTAIGGGGGSAYYATGGKSGGSGGGGADDFYNATYPAAEFPGQGTFGQGNAGGVPANIGPFATGGGGAGTAGITGAWDGGSSGGGNGGAGISSAISGTVTAYAGGGAGGGGQPAITPTGGVGGGGNGGSGASNVPTAGASNTGGGGGGDWNNISSAGNGGSGIVILSYPDTYAAATSTTGSPTVSTSGSGSIVFDGTGDYVRYSTSTNYAFGTGDFTVEAFIYRSNTDGMIVDARSGAASEPWCMYLSNGASAYLAWINGSTNPNTSTSISASTWTHVVACRSGTVLKLFINGVAGYTGTDTTNYTTTSPLFVGINANTSSNPFSGYISNVRITKGTAVYTADFTPPTAPLTKLTNTGLLLNTVSGAVFADSATGATTNGTGGQVAWNASSPFTVTGYKNRVYTWTTSGSITF